MNLFIDADGCPVTELAIRLAKRRGIACTIVCDTAHNIHYDGVQTLTVSKGADSADFALVNLLSPGDLVITQDYGLAAMCLSRNAIILHPDGMRYTTENIDALLSFRAVSARIRRGGGRLRGPSRRTAAQDQAFCAAMEALLEDTP